MRVLGHSSAFISIKEDVINVKRSSNQRLRISLLISKITGTTERSNSPQALINGAKIKVNLDLVVLKSNQRKSKTRVGTEPELKRNVKSSLGKSIARSTHLTDTSIETGAVNIFKLRVSDEGKLGSITNHLEVTTLLLGTDSQLVPDVHPVTILSVNTLATNLNLNLGDKLLTREIQPTSVSLSITLSNLGKSHLEVSAVAQITIAANSTLDSATEIGLSVKSLFDRFDREVSVSAVSHLPESDLRITS